MNLLPQTSRRAFLKFCALSASLLALPPGAARLLAEGLARRGRVPVIWLSFQACTGCTESLTRSAAPSLERLLFEWISLDYHHTLQAAAGAAAERARDTVLAASAGERLLIVDGAVPTALDGACSTIAGEDNLSLLRRCVAAAQAVLAVGSCASDGGLPAAAPNPTGAHGLAELMRRGMVPQRPLLNLPGCPPVPEVIGAVLAHRVAFGTFPPQDAQGRPLAFYGETIHDRCSRRGHYEAGRFAKAFDDAGARAGWCLLELGCRGPLTHNACATLRWNGVSNPIESGHPCLGCSEAGFWDRGRFYHPLDPAELPPTPAPSDRVQQGAQVYERHCIYCHDVDPARLKTPPAEVPALLRSGRIRAHRFRLEDGDMEALVAYLRQAK